MPTDLVTPREVPTKQQNDQHDPIPSEFITAVDQSPGIGSTSASDADHSSPLDDHFGTHNHYNEQQGHTSSNQSSRYDSFPASFPSPDSTSNGSYPPTYPTQRPGTSHQPSSGPSMPYFTNRDNQNEYSSFHNPPNMSSRPSPPNMNNSGVPQQKIRINTQPDECYQSPLSQFNMPTPDRPVDYSNFSFDVPSGRESRPEPNYNHDHATRVGQGAALSAPPSDPSNMSIIPTPTGQDQKYTDITEFLNMPQSQAAKHLGIPPSTLSKRWREAAAPNRKWPYRTVCKIDKEITTLLHNIPQDGVIPKEIEAKLATLIARRQEELKPIVIRL